MKPTVAKLKKIRRLSKLDRPLPDVEPKIKMGKPQTAVFKVESLK